MLHPEVIEAFEARGTWDEDGLAYLDGKRLPDFDILTLDQEFGGDAWK